MLLAAATIIAISVAIEVIAQDTLKAIDWHAHRGLSFLQIGLRHVNRLCYQRLPLPPLRDFQRIKCSTIHTQLNTSGSVLDCVRLCCCHVPRYLTSIPRYMTAPFLART
jgi:hypothetical protein